MARKSKEEVLEGIRSVSKTLGTKALSKTLFFKNSDITISDVLRHFEKWSDACHAAGVQHDSSRDPISDEELLTDWGLVTRDLGYVPPLTAYKIRGKHGRNAFNRFGAWVDVPDAFRKIFAHSVKWEDVLEIVEQHSRKPKTKKTIPEPKTNGGRHWLHGKLDSRPIYGDPIDFRGLRHEPVNEQGVVFLFGMVALELGYLVEAMQGGFPDCEAKRQISRGQWQTIQIEFEYESKNFVEHGHDPKKCDVIVCWIHNWKDCPDDIEVLALSDVIKKLPRTPNTPR